MRGYYCITGTPGTGKKTIAPMVAARLGVPCLSLNELAIKYGLLDRRGGGAVDVSELRKRLVRDAEGRCLIYGHLVPYVLEKRDVARVAVLRCDPSALKLRLRSRRYSSEKVIENVEAELIGVIASDSKETFGFVKVVELDNSAAPLGKAVAEVAGLLSAQRRRPVPVDWLRSYDSPRKLRSLLSPGIATSASI